MYFRFDWSNNCGNFFRRELVKYILTILKRNISPAKLQANKNAHVHMKWQQNRHSFCLMEIRLKRTPKIKFFRTFCLKKWTQRKIQLLIDHKNIIVNKNRTDFFSEFGLKFNSSIYMLFPYANYFTHHIISNLIYIGYSHCNI